MKIIEKLRKNLNLHNILYNKRIVVVLSVVLSFIAWLIVKINLNPIREQIFTDISINVSIDNTAASDMGLGIISDVGSQKFTVKVSGPNYVVSSLKAEDFILSADVTDINAAGTYALDVHAARNSSKSGYTFSSISPDVIDVTFDYIDTKEFTLYPKLIGVSAAEGLIAEAPVVSAADNSTITVKGPRSIIQKISTVGSYAEVNKTLDVTQSYDSEIYLYDDKGEIIYRYSLDGKIYDGSDNLIEKNNLSLSFTSVKVTQPISKKQTFKVNSVFTNLPAGLSADKISYKIDHSSASVIGTPDVVDAMKEITLSAIDFRSVSPSSNVFEVSPALPDGVKLLDNIEYFTVSIDTSGWSENYYNVSNMEFKGLDSSLAARLSGRIRNVKICGPTDIINKLAATDLYAEADLTDKSAGEHTIEITIKSKKYNNIWQVGAYSATVTITE